MRCMDSFASKQGEEIHPWLDECEGGGGICVCEVCRMAEKKRREDKEGKGKFEEEREEEVVCFRSFVLDAFTHENLRMWRHSSSSSSRRRHLLRHPTTASFRRLHVSYFLLLSAVGSLLLLPLLPFTDAVYNAVSALSLTGLCSVPMHSFSLPYLSLLLLLMLLGSHAFTSAIPLYIRRHSASRRPPPPSPPLPSPPHSPHSIAISPPPSKLSTIRRAQSMPALPSASLIRRSIASARHLLLWPLLPPPATDKKPSLRHGNDDLESPRAPAAPNNGGDEAARLEGDALALLVWIVPAFLLLSVTLGFAACVASIAASGSARRVLRERGVSVAFFSIFATVSALGNVGLLPLDDNMVALRGDWGLLVSVIALILVGNTLYAPALRGVVWALRRAAERRKEAEVLEYMLRSPRRCFTHLYPRAETLWLIGTVVLLNGVQTAVICGMDWAVLGGRRLGVGNKLVEALFSSVATRNGGMNAVNIATFSAATLLLSALMMYIGVYPVYLSRESSRELISEQHGSLTITKEILLIQFRKILARDSLYLFIATFFICLTERNSIKEDPFNFSIFNILFETISAYGNVGISLGYSCQLQISSSKDTCVDVPYSFSGKWSNMGKWILICVMLLGRHRTLPNDLDWAVTVPRYTSS